MGRVTSRCAADLRAASAPSAGVHSARAGWAGGHSAGAQSADAHGGGPHASEPQAVGATVVFLTTSYPRDAGDPGGHFVATEARALALRGVRVHVLAPGLPSHREERDGITIHWLGAERLFGWPGFAARLRQAPWRALELGATAWQLTRALAAAGPANAVVAHWLVPCAYPLAWLVDAPLDAVAHGADVRLLRALPAPLRHLIVRAILQRATSLRFAAASLRDELAASLAPSLAARLIERSTVAPPPLGLDEQAARTASEQARTRAKLGGDDARPLVVVVGRLVADKRIELALRAAALVSAHAPHANALGSAHAPHANALGSAHAPHANALGSAPAVRVIVVGDGPERAPLELLATELELDCVFRGLVPRQDALTIIAAASVLVHPSACEGAPTVVREARALGVEVVTCGAGDVGRWAESDPGIRVVLAEATAIAAAVAGVLTLP
ncbi:MAG: glycosyltransferase [Myxococcales bacterium]|nr:glycosyltransferase [Myxococcales bacterium]